VGEEGAVADEKHEVERRAHTMARLILFACGDDGLVGAPRRFLEAAVDEAPALDVRLPGVVLDDLPRRLCAQRLLDLIDGERGSDLARGVSAHPICDDEQAEFGDAAEAVLVGLSPLALDRHGCEVDSEVEGWDDGPGALGLERLGVRIGGHVGIIVQTARRGAICRVVG